MKPAPFVHHAPRTVEEAVAVLGEVGHDGKVLAGGQSLIPVLNMRLATPAHLVDINAVAGLDTVEVRGGAVRVGALARQRRVERSEEVAAALPLLCEALTFVAHPVIRNRGTCVGSLAHADAAAELPAVLALTGGVVEVVGPGGRREVPVADFFRGALETALAADELAVAARFPLLPPGTGTVFTESARRHGDYALAGVAAAVSIQDGVVSSARASFVSVTDVPLVLDVTEAVRGQEAPLARWDGAADLVHDVVDPESDIHASAGYRRALVTELARRAFADAASRAVKEGDSAA